MSGIFRIISTADQLIEATKDKTARYLIIRNDITDLPSLKLQPFQSISGEFDGKKITFSKDAEGFCLTKGNELKNLRIETTPDKRAVFQDPDVESLGIHLLTRITVVGQISFIISSNIKKGKIDAAFVHVEEASTFHLTDRPNKFSVDMVQGAMTIWNKSESNDISIDVDITHFSCGSETRPIAGSGLLICGFDDHQGSVNSTHISTGHIYTRGEIGRGVANLVCAGVAIGYQVQIHNINNYGRITCYGGNEMGIYNWGNVAKWEVTDRIETHGDNGCGIINAGEINKLTLSHSIETFGVGARGFYMFSGKLKDLQIEQVLTHGDAASALQFNMFIDRLSVSKNLITFGNAIQVKFADSIVKVAADGICIKYGGTLRVLKVSGEITTHGNDNHCIYSEGSIEKAFIAGNVTAKGENAVALEVIEGFFAGDGINFISEKWAAIKLQGAKFNNCHNLQAHGKDIDILMDSLSSVNRNIFSPEYLKDIFQDNVRLEYFENLKKDDDTEEKKEKDIEKGFTIKAKDISADEVKKEGIHPMSCAPDPDIKDSDEKDKKEDDKKD